MTVDVAQLERKLIEWVAEWNEGESPDGFDASTDLFASGALDSMGFTGLIIYLESETDTEFDFEVAKAGEEVSIQRLLEYSFAKEPAEQ